MLLDEECQVGTVLAAAGGDVNEGSDAWFVKDVYVT